LRIKNSEAAEYSPQTFLQTFLFLDTKRPSMSAFHRLTTAVVLLLLVVGCSSEATQIKITGKVSLDEGPINNGTLRLTPVKADGKHGGAIIKDGKFAGEAFPGQYKVEINSSRPAKKQMKQLDGPGSDDPTLEEAIPPKYNLRTELTWDVSLTGSSKDFLLKSGK
jgi:hypothetical protein